MESAHHEAGAISAHRSEALTDGIYAVAMTLLVIELKLPAHDLLHSSEDLAQGLADLYPKFLAWLISFFVLAFFWFGHQRSFQYVRRVDGPLTALNLGQLAAVSLMPFSCALAGEHVTWLPSQVIYSINMALLSLLALATTRYIFRHPELASAPMPAARYRGARLRVSGLIVVSVVAVLFAMAVPGAGNAAFMIMGVINPLSRALERREMAAEARGTAAADVAAPAP